MEEMRVSSKPTPCLSLFHSNGGRQNELKFITPVVQVRKSNGLLFIASPAAEPGLLIPILKNIIIT